MDYQWGWRPYVPVARLRSEARRKLEQLRQKRPVSPVVIEGRNIAKTFWGKAWCENLERYSDFQNRLPRGRTYLRNGSVIDLQISPGQVEALVSGSRVYKIVVNITPVSKARWKAICKDCAGAIDSVIELLQGRLSQAVMERICREKAGLFPTPEEIKLSCSCPDWAAMCKHVAAVLYGIGARLDQEPALLFRLHQVDEKELITKAGAAIPLSKKLPPATILKSSNLSELFGLDLAEADKTSLGRPRTKLRRRKPSRKTLRRSQ
ncbi:MAG: SWIM zinc finger family protein [Acidobacteria bacterium]|nr:SWIM zinc finger family protein [Acidobacteriota bacterium]